MDKNFIIIPENGQKTLLLQGTIKMKTITYSQPQYIHAELSSGAKLCRSTPLFKE